MEDLKDNHIVLLIHSSLELEREGKVEESHKIFTQAWDISSNDYEKCIAAHFVARHQKIIEDTLNWNYRSLERANKVVTKLVEAFYPSLYLCIGISHEDLDNYKEAKKYFDLSAEKVVILPDDEYGKGIRENINMGLERIEKRRERGSKKQNCS